MKLNEKSIHYKKVVAMPGATPPSNNSDHIFIDMTSAVHPDHTVIEMPETDIDIARANYQARIDSHGEYVVRAVDAFRFLATSGLSYLALSPLKLAGDAFDYGANQAKNAGYSNVSSALNLVSGTLSYAGMAQMLVQNFVPVLVALGLGTAGAPELNKYMKSQLEAYTSSLRKQNLPLPNSTAWHLLADSIEQGVFGDLLTPALLAIAQTETVREFAKPANEAVFSGLASVFNAFSGWVAQEPDLDHKHSKAVQDAKGSEPGLARIKRDATTRVNVADGLHPSLVTKFTKDNKVYTDTAIQDILDGFNTKLDALPGGSTITKEQYLAQVSSLGLASPSYPLDNPEGPFNVYDVLQILNSQTLKDASGCTDQVPSVLNQMGMEIVMNVKGLTLAQITSLEPTVPIVPCYTVPSPLLSPNQSAIVQDLATNSKLYAVVSGLTQSLSDAQGTSVVQLLTSYANQCFSSDSLVLAGDQVNLQESQALSMAQAVFGQLISPASTETEMNAILTAAAATLSRCGDPAAPYPNSNGGTTSTAGPTTLSPGTPAASSSTADIGLPVGAGVGGTVLLLLTGLFAKIIHDRRNPVRVPVVPNDPVGNHVNIALANLEPVNPADEGNF